MKLHVRANDRSGLWEIRDEFHSLVCTLDSESVATTMASAFDFLEALTIIRDSDGDKEDMREMAQAAIERMHGNPAYCEVSEAADTIHCVVACRNSVGEPDLFFIKVRCTKLQYNNGEHYEAAQSAAEEEGYETCLAYDENDSGGQAMVTLSTWDRTPLVDITPSGAARAMQAVKSISSLSVEAQELHALWMGSGGDPEIWKKYEAKLAEIEARKAVKP